ncbi:hypothetical protein Pelo_10811 [Pelomyxa schiedti]|nr:hypothetical protein Pelo_10811 [Pelomyxa schiedti]
MDGAGVEYIQKTKVLAVWEAFLQQLAKTGPPPKGTNVYEVAANFIHQWRADNTENARTATEPTTGSKQTKPTPHSRSGAGSGKKNRHNNHGSGSHSGSSNESGSGSFSASGDHAPHQIARPTATSVALESSKPAATPVQPITPTLTKATVADSPSPSAVAPPVAPVNTPAPTQTQTAKPEPKVVPSVPVVTVTAPPKADTATQSNATPNQENPLALPSLVVKDFSKKGSKSGSMDDFDLPDSDSQSKEWDTLASLEDSSSKPHKSSTITLTSTLEHVSPTTPAAPVGTSTDTAARLQSIMSRFSTPPIALASSTPPIPLGTNPLTNPLVSTLGSNPLANPLVLGTSPLGLGTPLGLGSPLNIGASPLGTPLTGLGASSLAGICQLGNIGASPLGSIGTSPLGAMGSSLGSIGAPLPLSGLSSILSKPLTASLPVTKPIETPKPAEPPEQPTPGPQQSEKASSCQNAALSEHTNSTTTASQIGATTQSLLGTTGISSLTATQNPLTGSVSDDFADLSGVVDEGGSDLNGVEDFDFSLSGSTKKGGAKKKSGKTKGNKAGKSPKGATGSDPDLSDLSDLSGFDDDLT